jgi:hypothetical protein
MSGPSYYDGVQWWWLVNTVTGYSGWVEQTALNLTASKNWNLRQQLAINKPPDVWLRVVPSSTSDQIVAVLRYETVVMVSGEPDYDGVQWWWPVTARTGQSGWIEQDSLTEYVPPTAIPRPQAPIVAPVNNPIPTIEEPPVVPATQPPGAPPQQPQPTKRPPPKPTTQPPPATEVPTVEQPPDIPATQAPTAEDPVEIPTTPPPGGQTPEYPPTLVAIDPVDPIVIAIAPSVTPAAQSAPAPGGCWHWNDYHQAKC